MKMILLFLAAFALSGCVIRAERVTINTTATVKATGLPMSLP